MSIASKSGHSVDDHGSARRNGGTPSGAGAAIRLLRVGRHSKDSMNSDNQQPFRVAPGSDIGAHLDVLKNSNSSSPTGRFRAVNAANQPNSETSAAPARHAEPVAHSKPAPARQTEPAQAKPKPTKPRHNPTRARRLLATVLTVAGIATFLAVIGLWPSGEAPSPGPGFLQSQTSAAETVKGTVVKHSVGACNSPDNGRVFDDQPRPGLTASLNDPAAPKCQLSVIELTSGPDEGKKTLLEASGLPGEIELAEGDKVVLAIHRPNAAGTGAVDNGAVPDPGLMTPAPGVVPAPAPEGAEGEPAPDAEAPAPTPAPAPAPEQEPAPESGAEAPAAPAPPAPPAPAPPAPAAPAADANVVDLAPHQVVDTASIGNTYTFLDMDRTTTIWLWLGAAVLLIILVGMTRGVLSLIGLGITLAAVMGFLVPALLRGGDPVALAITAGAAILFPVLFLVHGINWKSASALAGTLTTMVLAAGLANLAISTSQLRGLGNEDNLLIQLYLPDVSVTGLLLAGFIIGALGVLNDVTIAQASTVQELYEAAPRSRPMEVFRSAMRVGRDHIASMVYTLVLAYLGTALPLSILLSVSDRPLMQSLTSDVVATELLRSTIGAVALVLAVPITTLIAAYTVSPEGMKFPKRSRAASI